jgi:hypoxanthine phosphoribosyltransferase
MHSQSRWYDADIERVLITEEEIRAKTDELAKQVADDFAGIDQVVLVGGTVSY